ncbi:MAG TPA: cellulase N-terminal Ig-like domain-containing protein, partial [Candidatus Lokiarchaeia archaeon]|nr:cellulase N-terminal Ig-like domain-containing protein [Candidatus Lokiarchaeia archaeon]
MLVIINFGFVGSIIAWKILKDNPKILINQVGYFPDQDKTFLVQAEYFYGNYEGTFDLVDAQTGAAYLLNQPLIYIGQLWGKYYYQGNLTAFTTAGQYAIVARLGTNIIQSDTFAIGTDIYDLSLERGY